MGNPSSRAWGTGVRRNHPQCIANYDAPGPGISPLLKNRVSFDASIKPFHKTSLRLFVISRQQEGKEVETLCVFLEQFAKVLARRIQILSPLRCSMCMPGIQSSFPSYTAPVLIRPIDGQPTTAPPLSRSPSSCSRRPSPHTTHSALIL